MKVSIVATYCWVVDRGDLNLIWHPARHAAASAGPVRAPGRREQHLPGPAEDEPLCPPASADLFAPLEGSLSQPALAATSHPSTRYLHLCHACLVYSLLPLQMTDLMPQSMSRSGMHCIPLHGCTLRKESLTRKQLIRFTFYFDDHIKYHASCSAHDMLPQ